MIRKPAVAGVFYEGNPDSLKKQIQWCFKHKLGPGKIPEMGNKREIKGAMAPHAGYNYSGPIAAHTYAKIVEDGFPDTLVILCPNHYGMGSAVSTMVEGEWETPLGNVEIDSEFAATLAKEAYADPDPSAHLREHSLEVHLPFFQYFSRDFRMVPISMWMQDMETSLEIGSAIEEIALDLDRDVLVLASTDMTHYKSADIASKADGEVLDAIAKLDEKLMIKRVMDLNVNMCGYGPVAATMIASKRLGAQNAEILKYSTSGHLTGDLSEVVGYASAIFW